MDTRPRNKYNNNKPNFYKKKNFNRDNSNNSNNSNNRENSSFNTNKTNDEQKKAERIISDIPSLKNSLSTISFCDKECYNVNQNHIKDKLINYIQAKYPIQIIKNQYVMLNPRILRNISTHEHIVSVYTNGNPYLFFMTVIDGIKWCIFIDRKLKNGYSYPKIHCTQYNFADELFNDETMLNGELVRDVNRHWKFIISDILVYKGEDIQQKKNYLSRVELLHKIMNEEYTKNNDIEICPLYVKKLFQYSEIKSIFEDFIPDLSYTCKGLVFNTLNNKFSSYAWIIPKEKQIRVRKMNNEEAEVTYDPNANKTFVKVKDVFSKSMISTIPDSQYIEKENEKTLKIIKSAIPDIYDLYDTDVKLGIAYIPNIKISSMLNEFFSKDEKVIDTNVKCVFHNHFERWIPVEIV